MPNKFLSAAIENSTGVIIFSLDRNYCYTSFSLSHQQTMKKIWGVDIEIGTNMLGILKSEKPKDYAKAKTNFDRALSGEHFTKIEEYGDEHFQRTFWENRYDPVYDIGKNIIGLVVFVIDVSDRNLLIESIKGTGERFNLAVKAAKIGIWEWDMVVDKVFWSDEILAIFNLDDTFRHLGFAKYIEFVHPHDIDQLNASISSALKSNGQYFTQHRVTPPNGKLRWIEGMGKIILENGQPVKMVGTVIDITERKKLEEESKESYSLLQAAIEATADGILVVDNNGKISAYNKRFLSIYGFTEEEAHNQPDEVLLERAMKKIVEPEKFFAKVQELYANPEAESNDFIELINGTILHRFSKPQRLGDKVVGRVWSFRDITEQKRTEAESTDWKKRYELVSNSSGQVVYDYYLPSGKIIWSENILTELGYTQEELGTVDSWGEKIHPEDHTGAFAKLEKAEHESAKYEVTYRFQTKAGSYLYMSDQGFFLSNNIGKAYRMLGAMTNVTKQKEVEIALKESDNRFRTLQEASFGGIGLHYEGEILDANKGLSDITGFRYEELLGMNGVNLIAPEWRGFVREKINTGYEKPYDVIGIRKDGTRYNLEIHGRNLPYKGKVIRVTEFRDITERKQSEEKIIEQNNKLSLIAEDLKRKNEQLEEFTQIVSHNLRSPVSNILSLLDFYEKSNDEAEKVTFMKMLKDSGAKILTNLHELNEVLKIKQDKDIARQELYFETVFDSIRNLLSAKITEAGAIIHTDFANAPKVIYPNIYLESILVNLLTNALKYAHPNRKPEISFTTSMEKDHVTLKVADNGSGIDLKRYGHQIFKLRKTFHKHPESRGIGLFMIKSQIEAMGGDISISSEENIGTTFIVKL
ncbi:MAG: PAS domain S-box protein [Cyclobacteriaceae bacterium]